MRHRTTVIQYVMFDPSTNNCLFRVFYFLDIGTNMQVEPTVLQLVIIRPRQIGDVDIPELPHEVSQGQMELPSRENISCA